MRELLRPLAVAGAVIVVLFVQLVPKPVGASPSWFGSDFDAAGDTRAFVIGFADGIDESSARSLAATHYLRPERWIEGIHALVVASPDPNPADDDLAALAAETGVLYVEPDPAVVIQAAPNDPLFAADQWAPLRIGADLAWDMTTGSADVVVAVIDTGADPDHPDLAGKLVSGIDIYYRDDDPSDDNGHGTQVSGIIGAGTNNGVGIASIGYATKVMPVKVADYAGLSSYSRMSEGIVWAVDNGADVISISMGATMDLLNLRSAVAYAEAAGVVVVAASGNHGTDTPFYPAAYESVIGVGASDADDGRWSSSGYGQWLHLIAPGVGVLTTNWTGNGLGPYISLTGTSYAAPHVAGVVALMLSIRNELSPGEVRAELGRSAVELGDEGFDVLYGHGRLDAARAIRTLWEAAATQVMLLSLDGPGTIDGIDFVAADILEYDASDESWAMFFDASDVGIDRDVLAGFAELSNGELLLVYDGKVRLDGIGWVEPIDIVRFSPAQLGDDTSGTFTVFFDGSDVGLHKRVAIDALTLDAEQNLLLSFARKFELGGWSGSQHDVVRFSPSSLGPDTQGDWSLLLDGSAVGLDSMGEHLDALWFDAATSTLHLSTSGAFEVDGLLGNDGDVISCRLEIVAGAAACTFGDDLTWSASEHGLGSAGIDGLHHVITGE